MGPRTHRPPAFLETYETDPEADAIGHAIDDDEGDHAATFADELDIDESEVPY